MSKNKSRYQQMEQILTIALIAVAVLFLVYLIAAGCGVLWLKIFTAVLAILASGACLALLFFSAEILKKRSLWLTVGFASVVLCILVSLIFHYPSPNPSSPADSDKNSDSVGTAVFVSDYFRC